MSNKQTATKNEKPKDFSGKNGQGSAHQKTAATDEQVTKNQRDGSKHADDESDDKEVQSTLKSNGNDSKNASKNGSKNHSSKK